MRRISLVKVAPLSRFFLYILRAVVVFLVSTYLLAMLIGISLMLLTPEGVEFSRRPVENLPLGLLAFIVIRVPVTASFGTVFILTWAFYVICFSLAWRANGGFRKAMRGGVSQQRISASSNLLYIFPAISSALLVLVLVTQGLQEAVGVPTGTIEFEDTYSELFELSYSPIFEEVMFRISPYMLYSALITIRNLPEGRGLRASATLKQLISSVASPDRGKEALRPSIGRDGFRRGISTPEWALAILTSVIFGLAHYLSGSGWDIGKVTSSSIAGLAFFLSYLVYGFYAPILLHWFFNYYFYVYEFASKTYCGVFEVLENAVNLSVQASGVSVLLAVSTYLLWVIIRSKSGAPEA
ncbi:CPBP family intramembrane metalloprotease [Candidatus Bathyarchaeota archaeon]|nr:CPBP family intramembrane metalloprotease [Candidatus Bathyarchaeota archaeon]